MTACNLLVESVNRGLTLRVRGDYLGVAPDSLLTRNFADQLRAHKHDLLTLLQLPFCIFYSEALGDTIFFCEDEATKAVLVEAGADEWNIYTKEELRLIIEQHRRKPITVAELLQIHRARRMFKARIGG
jgi:hypothetical protein